MKKFALLFLALSSLTLASVTNSNGTNPIKDPASPTSSAGINVNVTATVIENGTELRITDMDGTEISAVNFNHELVTGDVATQTQQELTQKLLIKGEALGYAGTLAGSFKTSTLTLQNGNASLESLLTYNIGTVDSSAKEAPLTISSALSGNDAVAGTYTQMSTQYIITYNKTK